MKLPDIDGEWELITEAVSDIAYGETTRRYKRIPPKEKSLYRELWREFTEFSPPPSKNFSEHICNYIQALEKQVQSDGVALRACRNHVEELEKRVEIIEKSCTCNACKLERFK